MNSRCTWSSRSPQTPGTGSSAPWSPGHAQQYLVSHGPVTAPESEGRQGLPSLHSP